MKWCRCPKCGHKLFMYEQESDFAEVKINIKCSSCKRIIDVFISYGEAKSNESKA